jgi:hypothetical protein
MKLRKNKEQPSQSINIYKLAKRIEWRREQLSLEIETAVIKSRDQGLNPQKDVYSIWDANTRVNDKSNVRYQPMILTKQSHLLDKIFISLHNILIHPSLPSFWAHVQRYVRGTHYTK